MKAAARPALVPVLVLCAALAAPPEAAGTGEELRVPFPGAASEGGERTTEAAPRPSGATAASPVAPPDTPAAEDETANAADGTAGPEGAAADPAQGESADGSATIGIPERQAKTPPGGSRLLRVLGQLQGDPAAAPEASGAAPLAGPGVSGPGVSGAGVSGTRVFGTSVFAVEGCPRALLRRLLAGAAGEADALAALGIEHEILALCRERQEILAGLFEAEAALRELRTPPDALVAAALPPAQTGAVSVVPAPTRQVATAPAPSPLRAALAAAEDEVTEAEPQAPAQVSPAGVSSAQVSPRYAWFSIVGTAGVLRAGITDGADVWFVREGDPLPGGARIAAIAARPPGVRVTDGDGNGGTALLPYAGTSFSSARVAGASVAGTSFRARPGGAP